MSALPLRLVCATRLDQHRFFAESATGRSIKSFIAVSGAELRLFAENRAGLPAVYNHAIAEAATSPATLVFLHDDLLIGDFFWSRRILDGLEHFDIVGLAGNTRRVPFQPTWAHVNLDFAWDDRANLSGVVAHGDVFPPAAVQPYGETGRACKLLDGLLLAAHSTTLAQHGVRFDERYTFHFYDLDFCRQAEAAGLSMGTIPLAVVHQSGGNFASEAWRNGYASYIDKWQE